MSDGHVPVLLEETLAALDPKPGQVFVDCTAGLGGHAAAVAERLGTGGTVVLFDLDPGNLAMAVERVKGVPNAPRVEAVHANFAEVPRRLREMGISADLLLADLGFASPQVNDPKRGLSFSRDGPLDMRLDPNGPVTAAQLVGGLSARELSDIIEEYGEERQAWRIAQKLVAERAVEPILTTARLAGIVRSVVGYSRPHGQPSIDPATRTFQALRIAVNDEMANLRSILEGVERAARTGSASGMAGWLAASATIVFIAFHSLEDRPIKQTFASVVEQGLAESITRKPARATDAEVGRNPRSRSAKLRAIRLLPPHARIG